MADMSESIIGACLLHGGEDEAILAKTSPMRCECPRQCIKQVEKFQSILKYKFNEPAYLLQALTHASTFNRCRCTESYERLAFLGDAILNFLITVILYRAGFTKDPGQLTSSRSALVSNNTFAKMAIKYNFHNHIIHADKQLSNELNLTNENIKNGPNLDFLDDVEFDGKTKFSADVFEAVAGAVYLDSGCSLDTVYSLYYPMMKELIDEETKKPTKNIVTRLFEMFPGKDRIKFEYWEATVEDESDFVYCAKCTIHGVEKEFFGEGVTKRQAKLGAVIKAMVGLPTEEEKIKLDEQWAEKMRQPRPKPGGGKEREEHKGNQASDTCTIH